MTLEMDEIISKKKGIGEENHRISDFSFPKT